MSPRPDAARIVAADPFWGVVMGTMRAARRALAFTGAALALMLGGCEQSVDPKKSADELHAMRASVVAEIQEMADDLAEGGVRLEGATGHVDEEGMSTYRARDYRASVTIAPGEGSEADQVGRAATPLEKAGWTRGSEGLDPDEPHPWVQLAKDDFRTKIGWAKHGPRELVLSLDKAGEVEVPTDAPVVDRDNSEEIPLD